MTPAWAGVLAGALVISLSACGGGSSTNADAADDAVLDAFVAQAGAATAVAGCSDLVPATVGADRARRARRLPNVRLSCLGDAQKVDLSGLRGPALLNVWASWCGPCKEELPYLTAARNALGDQVEFVGIAIVDDDAQSRRWLSFHGVTWPSLSDPEGRVRGPLRVPGPPVTFFIGSDGSIEGTHYGAFTSARQVEDEVRKHLGIAG